jgi:hypothetical protein
LIMQQGVGECQVTAHTARAENWLLGYKRSCWVLQNSREAV